MSSAFPNYYELLHISPTATTDEIRTAYKKESLRTHPDRLGNATQEEKRAATEKFQAVADAYYVLCDPVRRKEYDTLFTQRTSHFTTDPGASESFFAQFANLFTGGSSEPPPHRPDPEGVFGDVFEDLLRPEVEKHASWWTYLGAASGAGLGYIIANIPGMIMGGYAGNRLGAIRDAKGKPVAVVFSQLGGSQKAEILKILAIKVLGSI